MNNAVGQGASSQRQAELGFVVEHVLGLALDKCPRHVKLGSTAGKRRARRLTWYSLDPFAVHLMHRLDCLTVRGHKNETTAVRCAYPKTYRRRPSPSNCDRRIECSTTP